MTRARLLSGHASAHRRRVFALVALAAVLSGCSSDLGMPSPVTSEGEQSRDLWRVFVVLAIIIGLIVYGLIAFVVIRYRHRRVGEGEASQRQYNVPLEITYTALPLVIVGVLLGISIRAENDIISTSARPDVTVRVVGFQWQWQFAYEGTSVVVTGVPGKEPVLVLPTERTVRLEMVSADVVHSFWVPRFIEKRDLTPGFYDNAIEVRVTEPGEWDGFCSEFCGLDHTNMRFRVRALPAADFDDWLASGGTSS